MELEVTWPRLVRVWWAHTWRSAVTMVGVFIIAGVIGFVLGLIMNLVGASETTLSLVSAPIGAAIGIGMSLIPMRLILGKDFGEFRLLLVPKAHDEGNDEQLNA